MEAVEAAQLSLSIDQCLFKQACVTPKIKVVISCQESHTLFHFGTKEQASLMCHLASMNRMCVRSLPKSLSCSLKSNFTVATQAEDESRPIWTHVRSDLHLMRSHIRLYCGSLTLDAAQWKSTCSACIKSSISSPNSSERRVILSHTFSSLYQGRLRALWGCHADPGDKMMSHRDE